MAHSLRFSDPRFTVEFWLKIAILAGLIALLSQVWRSSWLPGQNPTASPSDIPGGDGARPTLEKCHLFSDPGRERLESLCRILLPAQGHSLLRWTGTDSWSNVGTTGSEGGLCWGSTHGPQMQYQGDCGLHGWSPDIFQVRS